VAGAEGLRARVLSLVENWMKSAAFEAQEYMRLVIAAFRGFVTRPIYRHDIIEQFDLIGIGSLTVVLLTGFFTGAALASQTGITLDQFGARPVVGRLVSASIVKELGPVLTALMLTGRIGSGIAAELGSMVVTDQINALRALGTDPIRKLVVPRVLAGLLMTPVLTIVSDFVGILGGWIVARFQLQVASGLYWSSVTQALFMADLQQGLLKPFVFGFLIVTIACHVGLRTTGGTQGVGRATTISVVAGSVAVIAMDFFLTQVLVTFLYS
jgi:phospholipid/cholesterol/gamma-HCH transport system permease protein